mgnify:FL=1
MGWYILKHKEETLHLKEGMDVYYGGVAECCLKHFRWDCSIIWYTSFSSHFTYYKHATAYWYNFTFAKYKIYKRCGRIVEISQHYDIMIHMEGEVL